MERLTFDVIRDVYDDIQLTAESLIGQRGISWGIRTASEKVHEREMTKSKKEWINRLQADLDRLLGRMDKRN